MPVTSKAALDVNQTVRNLLVFFLVLVAVGWLPQVRILHLATTRSPIFERQARMGDLFNAKNQMQHFSALTIGPTFNYPAPAAFVVRFFLTSAHPKIYFVAAVVLSVAIAASLLLAALRKSQLRLPLAAATVFCFAAFGTPQIFALDRANLEWASWILVVLAMSCFFTRRYLAQALLLGLAVCMKPFPILFFLLLLYRRRYKEIALGLCVTAVLTAVALKALGPSVPQAYAALQVGMRAYKENYIQSIRMLDEMRFDHALMSPVRMVLTRMYGRPRMDPLALTGPSLPIFARLDLWRYFFSGVAVIGALATAWVARRLPALNQVLLISLAIMLLPFISSEYTLLTLYLPFGLILIWLSRDVAAGQAPMPPFAMLCLFPLLLAPLGLEFHMFVGIVQCLLLVALVIYALRVPMPMPYLDEGK